MPLLPCRRIGHVTKASITSMFGRLLDRNCLAIPLPLVKDGDLVALAQYMIRTPGGKTSRVTEVKEHADDSDVWGRVPSPPLVGAAFGRCCFSNFLSGGAAFLPLLWVGLRSPPLRFGGAAWFPSSLSGVAVSPFLLHGAAFLPLGGAVFFPSSFCWVVLLGFPSLGGVAVFSVLWVGLFYPCLLLGGAAWSTPPWGGCCVQLCLLLLWAVLLFQSPFR